MQHKIKKVVFNKYLYEDEHIIKVTHNHVSCISKEITIDMIVWFGTPAFLSFYNVFTPYVYYVFIWGLIITSYHIYDWYADACIITNKGVINVEWNGFFKNKSQRINHNDIVTMNIEKNGPMANILGYGHLVLSCQDGTQVTIQNANNPERAQSEIAKQKELLLIADNAATQAMAQFSKNRFQEAVAQDAGFTTETVKD